MVTIIMIKHLSYFIHLAKLFYALFFLITNHLNYFLFQFQNLIITIIIKDNYYFRSFIYFFKNLFCLELTLHLDHFHLIHSS